MPPFISFEGLDGSGKTTQVRLLADYLTHRGIQVSVLREPGSTPVGESIRDLLLGSQSQGLLPLSELLLFYAARNENLHQRIIPAQAEGKWILCDRFADASMAYQGYGRGLDRALVQSLDRMVNGGKKPDLTVLIDVEPSVAVARGQLQAKSFRSSQLILPFSGAGVDEGRFEAESLKFFRRVREGYLQIADQEPCRVHVLDGSHAIKDLHKEIVNLISPFLPKADAHGTE